MRPPLSEKHTGWISISDEPAPSEETAPQQKMSPPIAEQQAEQEPGAAHRIASMQEQGKSRRKKGRVAVM